MKSKSVVSKAVAAIRGNQSVVVADDPFVIMIERLATNEAVDPDKMQKLVDLQIQIMDRNARDEFYAAMSRVQATLPTVKTDAWNDQTKSRYARLSAISKAVTPIYTAEGFSASFWEGKDAPEGKIRIEGILRHRDGHSEPYGANLALDTVGIRGNVNKTNIHGSGSTFTYGRRYVKCMMFDIAVGDDVDGNTPVDTITDDQVADLESLITEVNADRAAFLTYCEVDSLDNLPSKMYKTVVQALERKRAQ